MIHAMFPKMKTMLAGIFTCAFLCFFTGCSSKPSAEQQKEADSKTANERDKNGKTPLQLAIANGQKGEAESLIGKGADVNAMFEGKRMIHLAALGGQKDMVELLVAKGADIRTPVQSDNTTVLHYASTRAVAELLVAAGLDFKSKNHAGMTPLEKAVERGNADVVEYLLSLGADPLALSRDQNMTPINYASTRAVAEMLVSKGASVNGGGAQNTRLLPPLYSAASKGHLEVVKYLIERGAEINANSHGGNALSITVENGHHEVVAFLLQSGATVDQSMGSNYSLLATAARKGHRIVAEVLLANGIDPNSGNPLPLILAASKADKDMLEILVSRGADVKLNNNGWTALHAAASGKDGLPMMQRAILPTEKDMTNDYLLCAQFLIEKGADVRAVAQSSRLTPLHKAAAAGLKPIVELFLAKGADVNARDEFDATPLHWAVINDVLPVVQLLLEKSADPNLPLNSKANVETTKSWSKMLPVVQSEAGGRVPLQLAHSKEMKELLSKHGAKDSPSVTVATTPSSVLPSSSAASPAPSAAANPPPGPPAKVILKVTSINTLSSPPSATVNNEDVQEGKMYTYKDGATRVEYRVVRIENEKIIVNYNGNEEAFPLGSSLDSFIEK